MHRLNPTALLAYYGESRRHVYILAGIDSVRYIMKFVQTTPAKPNKAP